MVENVKTYLKTTANVITNIRGQSWMCFGWCRLTNDTRVAVYWSLAVIMFVLIGMVYVWTKDLPGAARTPRDRLWVKGG